MAVQPQHRQDIESMLTWQKLIQHQQIRRRRLTIKKKWLGVMVGVNLPTHLFALTSQERTHCLIVVKDPYFHLPIRNQIGLHGLKLAGSVQSHRINSADFELRNLKNNFGN